LSRTPSGIEGLDPLIEGGFPASSLILVAGTPGTGKTAMGCSFLYHGASDLGENSVYVSFAESKATLYQNAAKVGFNFEALEKAGKFKFLDLISVKKEGISPTIDFVLEAMSKPHAKRLFIDSFTALSNGFTDRSEARAFLHSVLSKIVRQMGCTTMLAVEIPLGLKSIGTGIEEFVADCVIVLSMRVLNGRAIRQLRLLKFRGTELSQHQFVFTLSGGFRVFPPFRFARDFVKKRFIPIPAPEGYFSTGSPHLDRILGGGYARGSNVLFEIGEGVPAEAYQALIGPTIFNFVAQGRPSIIFPSESYSSKLAERDDMAYVGRENFYKIYKICEQKGVIPEPKSHVVEFEGRSYEHDLDVRTRLRAKLEEKTGQPSLSVISWNRLEGTYGSENLVREQTKVLPRAIELGRLNIYFTKPGVGAIDHLKNGCQYHFVLNAFRGTVLLYGQKPFFKAYIVEQDVSRGFSEPKLTPIE